MTPEFKQELQKLIYEAASKYQVNYSYEQAFHDGCEFLIPLIETLIETRNNYIATCEYSDNSRLQNIHDKSLLNLLRGS